MDNKTVNILAVRCSYDSMKFRLSKPLKTKVVESLTNAEKLFETLSKEAQ